MNQQDAHGSNNTPLGQNPPHIGRPVAPPAPETPPITEGEIEKRVAYLDGVNGSAGHHLEDPYLRSLVRQQVAGEITGDEARELGRQYLESGRRP